MMSDTLPYVGFGHDSDREICAVVGSERCMSLASFFGSAPFAREAGNEVILARALNHFANDMEYKVIDDPVAYAKAYLKRYAAEEELEWDQFVPRAGDFDLPDLRLLSLPKVENGQITFFVNKRSGDFPYRVEGPADGSGTLEYTPL